MKIKSSFTIESSVNVILPLTIAFVICLATSLLFLNLRYLNKAGYYSIVKIKLPNVFNGLIRNLLM